MPTRKKKRYDQAYPFPNDSWGYQYSATFDGNGCADFPQVVIPDLTAWTLTIDVDFQSDGSEFYNMVGDNETSGDRLKQTDGNNFISIRASDNLEKGWAFGSGLLNRGRSTVIVSCNSSRMVNLTIIDSTGTYDYGEIVLATSEIYFDCFGRGDPSQKGFVGGYFSTEITMGGVLVTNQTPVANDMFKESVSDTTNSPSGTGTTFNFLGDNVPLGAVVIEDGVVKQSRYVGNFKNPSGTASVDKVVISNSTFDPNLDFEVLIHLNADILSTSYAGVFGNGGSLTESRGLWIERDNLSNSVVVNVYMGLVRKTIVVPNIFTSIDAKITVKRVGVTMTAYLNGVSAGSVDLTAFTINTNANITLGALFSDRSIIAEYYQTRLIQGASSFDLCFCEGSGSIVFDRTGNGFDGLITDGAPNDFWLKTLVPL